MAGRGRAALRLPSGKASPRADAPGSSERGSTVLETLIAAIAGAGMALSSGSDPQNPLSFASGRVAGALRIEGDRYICATSADGRWSEPGDQGMCDVLTEASGGRILRQAGSNAEYWGVQSLQVGGAPLPDPGDSGSLVFSSSARIRVRSDGSVAACAAVGRPVVRPTPGFEYAPDVCTLYPPGTERVFAPDPARTQPAEALLSLAFYLRRP